MAETIQVTLKTIADISDVTSNVKQIQEYLNKLNLPDNLKTRFAKLFTDVEKNATKASDAMAKGFKDRSNLTTYTRALDNINLAVGKIASNISSIDATKLNIHASDAEYQAINKQIQELRSNLEAINASNLERVNSVMTSFEGTAPSSAKAWQAFVTAFETNDLDQAEKALARLQIQLNKFTATHQDQSQWDEKWKTYAEGVKIYQEALAAARGQTDETRTATEALHIAEEQLANLDDAALQRVVQELMQYGTATKQAAAETDRFVTNQKDAAASTSLMNNELSMVKSRIAYFFGITNAVNLFRRAIRSAYETVKDLDAVMTEAAVVTEFDVSDMWEQLPQYTKRATELGATIHDVYEASTLYYQQGLKTNEVTELTNETLKMARIAGLGAEDATQRMTNALRGFNMEINEASAQRINDVYSKLAAITAADTDQISTAMTKVASLAHSANMEFETTAAFLSQIIETTQESA